MIPLLLMGQLALAHHNKGLPHYGYFENYPQVPTDEYVLLEGRWEVGATIFNFQGLDARETSDTPNDVKFFAYVYDLELDRGYEGPMVLEVLQDGQTVAATERIEPDSEGVYVSRETLPESGDYDLVFAFEAEGQPIRVAMPFEVDLAADRVNWGIVGGIGAGVALLFGLALSGRKRRLTRSAAPAAATG